MSLQEELPIWNAALSAYEREDVTSALSLFERLHPTTKILFNIGIIYATIGHHKSAVEKFETAGSRDKYLGIAHFQCGVSYFLLGKSYLALEAFERALVSLRGNGSIDYEQLGLKFKLYKAEILFNIGLCRIRMGDIRRGLADINSAHNYRSTPTHDVIIQAIRDRAEGYTIFSIPVGVLFEPFGSQVKNLPLAEANLVLAAEQLAGVTKLDADQPWLLGASHPSVISNLQVQTPPRRAKTPQPPATPAWPSDPPARTFEMDLPPRPASAPESSQATDLSRNRSAMPTTSRLTRARGKSVSEGTKIGRSRSAAVTAPQQMDIPPVPVAPLNIVKPQSYRALPPIPAEPEPKLPKRDTIDVTIQDLISQYYLPSPVAPRTPLSRADSPSLPEDEDDEADVSLPYLRPAASSDPLRFLNEPPTRPLPRTPRRPLPAHPEPKTSAPSTVSPDSAPRHHLLRRATGSPTKGLLSEDEGYHTGSSISSYDSSSSSKTRPVSVKKSRRTRTMATLTDDEGYTTDKVVASGKIKFKLHWNDEIRAILLPPDAPLHVFYSKVAAKLDVPTNGMNISFGLEKNVKQILRDEGDYQKVMDFAKTKSGGRMHVWCV